MRNDIITAFQTVYRIEDSTAPGIDAGDWARCRRSVDSHMIKFSVDDGRTGTFRYRRWPEYLASWILAVPLTSLFLILLIEPLLSDSGTLPALLLMIIGYKIALVITNAIHLPVLNVHWIFTEFRTLLLKPGAGAVLRLGPFPFCIQRTISREGIQRIVLERHKCGKGLGFLYYWMSPGHLHSLYLLMDGNTKHYLARNESKDGWLASEGKKLATFLGVEFTETY
jgi:hypothetical protein